MVTETPLDWSLIETSRDGLLDEILEETMMGKPTRGRILHVVHDQKKVMAVPHSSEQLKKGKDGDKVE